ncbi:22447_t:CDS:2 [Cetraspora pellucida]|uniref:22447_t:CDS:1 n=1 Tax=Cetraspora pellucida TaxID=1433469 RepID=A0A9N8YXI0_9GLOM|nr:22447_t:CDS:2 [Cetraspora pellucida]
MEQNMTTNSNNSNSTTHSNMPTHIDLSNIDENTKAYIDAACQASSNAIICNIKSYIDQTMATQTNLINKLNNRLDTYLNNQQAQKTPSVSNSYSQEINYNQTNKNNLGHNHEFNIANPQHPDEQSSNSTNQQGNCPLTPILNNLLINSRDTITQDKAHITTQPTPQTNSMICLKSTHRKYPSIEYTDIENLPPVQGFNNPQAALIERIRLWWILNWHEGQKAIEMILNKPNLPIRLWKAIAFGSYADLHEFTHKNIKLFLKNNDEDQTLTTAEEGTIAIRKRNQSHKFNNISEWLLAFKSYMDAVLIIFDTREQELNTYRDHINSLCIKQEFDAVLTYDEDRRLHLTINRDTTLLDRDLEASGENFDSTTTKRYRSTNSQQTFKSDISWNNGKQICINWNKKAWPP